MAEEGYIKFRCLFSEKNCVESQEIKEINFWRRRLCSIGLIGANENGIGFGNISRRTGDKEFIITGSGTGKYNKLGTEHYSKVIGWDIDKNLVECVGLISASSEALTHAAIYEKERSVKAVVHTHHNVLWSNLKNKYRVTADYALFGTPEMAREIQRFLNIDKSENIIIMGGHKDGIITYGKSMTEAGNLIVAQLEEM
ncbi:class II aldolase/adducin family protein [Bacteroidota bacterium]